MADGVWKGVYPLGFWVLRSTFALLLLEKVTREKKKQEKYRGGEAEKD